jgi:hypothetical protein
MREMVSSDSCPFFACLEPQAFDTQGSTWAFEIPRFDEREDLAAPLSTKRIQPVDLLSFARSCHHLLSTPLTSFALERVLREPILRRSISEDTQRDLASA